MIWVAMTSELSKQRTDVILPIILVALFLTRKSFSGAFSSNSRLDIREVKTESVRALSGYSGIKFLSSEIQ